MHLFFIRTLHASIFFVLYVSPFFYVSYVPSLFYVPSFLSVLRAFIFFMYLHFTYVYANKIHRNSWTSICPRLSSIFTSTKLFCETFLFFSFFGFFKRKILITFIAEEKTWRFERLEHYLAWEIHGMLKSVTVSRNKEIITNIFG